MGFDEQDEHFQLFPDHKVLLQKLHSSMHSATSTSARCYFVWRQFRDFVNPGLKTITKAHFVKHLITALKGIKDISPEEKKVAEFETLQ